MLSFRHKTLIAISGALWFVIGLSLLTLGLNLINTVVETSSRLGTADYPLFSFFSSIAGGSDNASIVIITLCLILGFLKGKVIFKKSVSRVVRRIRSFSEPMPLYYIYSPAYYLLIGSMIFLGISIKYFGVPIDVRGFVDVTIGAALLNGSTLYFRSAFIPERA